MKKIIFIIPAFSLFFFCINSFAANTLVIDAESHTVTISAIDSDWSWLQSFPTFPNGIKIFSIRFNPGAAADRCIINAGNDAGSDLFDSSVASGDGDGTIQYYPTNIRLKPYLDFTDGTYNAAAKITIQLGE